MRWSQVWSAQLFGSKSRKISSCVGQDAPDCARLKLRVAANTRLNEHSLGVLVIGFHYMANSEQLKNVLKYHSIWLVAVVKHVYWFADVYNILWLVWNVYFPSSNRDITMYMFQFVLNHQPVLFLCQIWKKNPFFITSIFFFSGQQRMWFQNHLWGPAPTRSFRCSCGSAVERWQFFWVNNVKSKKKDGWSRWPTCFCMFFENGEFWTS